LLSTKVGARHQFLIDGLNGYVVNIDSNDELALKLHQLASQSKERLLEMSRVSYELSRSISPEITTASFMSVIARPDRA